MPKKIAIAMTLGVLLGLLSNIFGRISAVESGCSVVAAIFLRLILMIVVPFVFCSVVAGVVELGAVRRLPRLGLLCLGMTVLLSGISVAIGLSIANTLKPGTYLRESDRAKLLYNYKPSEAVVQGEKKSAWDELSSFVIAIVPKNPIGDAADALDPKANTGGILSVMFFAVCFGAAIGDNRSGPMAMLLTCIQGCQEVLARILVAVIRWAPIGVAAQLYVVTSRIGLDVFGLLGMFVGTVLLALTLHMFGTYSLCLMLIARMNPISFFRNIFEALIPAFCYASSSASLPVAIQVATEKLAVKDSVAKFVLTLGASANQNGTALYEGLTVLFLAQAYGVNLSIEQQLVIVGITILAGIGTAVGPGTAIPMVTSMATRIGLPADSIGLILGVDRILDMCRTTLNVAGDLVIAVCVEKLGAMIGFANAPEPTQSDLPLPQSSP